MKIVVQNVKKASVSIDNKIVSSIDRGYLLLVGFTEGDTFLVIDKMVDKVLNIRLFPDNEGKTNWSIQDIQGAILSVSQFTLYGDVSGGRRPSFTHALNPLESEKLYHYFNQQIERKYGIIATGVFGADMDVSLINEGPFTLILDSKELYEGK